MLHRKHGTVEGLDGIAACGTVFQFRKSHGGGVRPFLQRGLAAAEKEQCAAADTQLEKQIFFHFLSMFILTQRYGAKYKSEG
jgi:hypothetical protein